MATFEVMGKGETTVVGPRHVQSMCLSHLGGCHSHCTQAKERVKGREQPSLDSKWLWPRDVACNVTALTRQRQR